MNGAFLSVGAVRVAGPTGVASLQAQSEGLLWPELAGSGTDLSPKSG